ncbi:hypothetical protein T492DRAFT_101165 [Pavlovales sp. CCMP2436]|nr:hypothetical protein T492DRAFT_101165 [Pavlovales sp. CCMP2436]
MASDEPQSYDIFYAAFGNRLKLGVHEDERSRERLLGLLRFPSTHISSSSFLFSSSPSSPSSFSSSSSSSASSAAAFEISDGSPNSAPDAPSSTGANSSVDAGFVAASPTVGLRASSMASLSDYVQRMPASQKVPHLTPLP